MLCKNIFPTFHPFQSSEFARVRKKPGDSNSRSLFSRSVGLSPAHQGKERKRGKRRTICAKWTDEARVSIKLMNTQLIRDFPLDVNGSGFRIAKARATGPGATIVCLNTAVGSALVFPVPEEPYSSLLTLFHRCGSGISWLRARAAYPIRFSIPDIGMQ